MGAPKKFPNKEPLARSSDDDTSHEAAEDLTESGKRDTDKHLMLTWMIENPTRWGTAREMARDSGLPHDLTHKRLPDLMKDGFVRKGERRICTVSQKRAATWMVKTPAEPVEQQDADEPEQRSLFDGE